ncbi:MAG: GldG family protein [Angelakisella sp.]
MNIKKALTSKRFRYGGVSTAIAVVFLAVIIVINFLSVMLSDKFPLTIDLTPQKVFELSQDSIDYLKTMEKPVNITVMVDEQQLTQSGGYYNQVKNVIDGYPKHCQNITLTYLDPVKNPSFATMFEGQQVDYYDIVVESNGKVRKTPLNDMFNTSYNQYTGQTTISSSKVEQEMTSMIMNVTADRDIKVSLLTGHDEVYGAEITSLLEKNGYTVTQQNLSTDELDPDASMVLMLGTARDPDEAALKKLDTFLTNNGQLGKTLIFAPTPQATAATPKLDNFLAQWGVKYGTGVVMESDPKKIINNLPYMALVDYTMEDYTQTLHTQAKVLSPLGRELSTTFENMSGYSTEVLLSYSAKSYLLPADATKDWAPQADAMGTRPALIRSKFRQYEGMTEKASTVLTFAAPDIFNDMFLSSQSVANSEYLVAMFNTINERTDVISISPKNMGGQELGINQFWMLALGGIFVILVPAAVLIAGIVIWLRRRNR